MNDTAPVQTEIDIAEILQRIPHVSRPGQDRFGPNPQILL